MSFAFGFNTSTATSATTNFGGTTYRVILNAPMLAPPKCPDQLWIEKTTGVIKGPIHPHECARVRRAFTILEFSPGRWLGGDSDAFKVLSDAWDILKRRGFCG